MEVLIYPVPVQGPDAAPAIAEAIGYLNREKCVDVMIAGRGGGSLEDLWAFNEEIVARAIHASRIPVISAVGHETDYTIADFVADLRAPTPSVAAEMVVETEEHLWSTVQGLQARLGLAIRSVTDNLRSRLDHARRLLGDPRRRLDEYGQRVDELQGRLLSGLGHALRQARSHLGQMTAALDHLNPLAILARGYSVTRTVPAGRVIKDAGEVRIGDRIRTQVSRGVIISRVEGAEDR
jgi:exodeoxyribonuclease VII large subunit